MVAIKSYVGKQQLDNKTFDSFEEAWKVLISDLIMLNASFISDRHTKDDDKYIGLLADALSADHSGPGKFELDANGLASTIELVASE